MQSFPLGVTTGLTGVADAALQLPTAIGSLPHCEVNGLHVWRVETRVPKRTEAKIGHPDERRPASVPTNDGRCGRRAEDTSCEGVHECE